MLKLTRRTLTAALAAAGLAWAGAAAVADDATPTRTEKRSVQGVIRIERPDGTVEEHRFGGADAEQTLQEAIKELQQSAKKRASETATSKGLMRMPPVAVDPADRVLHYYRALSDVTSPAAKYGIGVSLGHAVPEALRVHLKLPKGEGLLVQAIADDSPAAKAGLKEHDILLKAGKTPLKAHHDLLGAVEAAGEKDEALSLSVLSAGERKTVELTPVKADTIEWKPTRTSLFRATDDIYHMTDDMVPPGAEGGYEEMYDEMLFHRFQPGLKLPHGVPGAPPVQFELERAIKLPSPELDQRLKNLERQLEKLTEQLERFEKSQTKEKGSK